MQMENNKKRWMLVFVCMFTAMFAFAQSASPAKEISKIKQSKQYLWAEATDSTEQAAYQIAKKELDNLVEEHIAASKIADDAKLIIVQNIASKTSSVNMLRGILHRVFVYVKKSDIVQTSGDVDVYQVVPTETSSETPQGEKAADDAKTEELLSHVEDIQEPVTQPVEQQVEVAQSEESLEAASVSSNSETNSYLASLPENRKQTLTSLLNTQTIEEAKAFLDKQYQLQYVKNYGKGLTCKNQNRCYWVLERDGQIVILTPLKTNGTRINVRTGQQEPFTNFNANMLWFAM